jgi:outer membrane lipoprotein-sorting protein
MRIILSFASILFCVTVTAQDLTFSPVAKSEISAYTASISKASSALTSLQCSFTQTKQIAVLSESVVSKGKLLYKKENKLSWQYLSPYPYLFALNGDKVTIKNDKSTKQFDTKSNALFKEISLLLVNSVSGKELIDAKKFDVSFFQNAKLVQVRLTPKNKTLKSMLSTISLNFDNTTYMVQTIVLTEPMGDTTTIVFSDKKINQPIDDEKFMVRE